MTHVVGLGVVVEVSASFAGDEQAFQRLLHRFRELVQPLVGDGVDVSFPPERRTRFCSDAKEAIRHAPVVNSVAVAL